MEFPDLSPGQAESVKQVLRDYADVYCPGNDRLGEYKGPMYRVQTGDHPPLYIRQFPLAQQQEEAMKEMTDTLLQRGVISQIGPKDGQGWNTPHFLVVKSHGKWRPVADFRAMNRIIHRFVWSVPSTIKTLQSIRKGRWFSKMDLFSGYHR